MDDVKEGAEPIDIIEFPGQGTGQTKWNPSTCISMTQYRRLSMMSWSTRGCRTLRELRAGIVHMVATIRLCKRNRRYYRCPH
jgi:hypothetical protein